MLRRLNKGAQLSSVSKNNFYFWQLEMETIKDDPDLMRSSVISLELTGHHQPPTIQLTQDDQLRPDLSPHPHRWSLPGDGCHPDREGGKTGRDRVRDHAGNNNN